eukprot:12317949-Karenia_brevis.AAC.1
MSSHLSKTMSTAAVAGASPVDEILACDGLRSNAWRSKGDQALNSNRINDIFITPTTYPRAQSGHGIHSKHRIMLQAYATIKDVKVWLIV